MGGSQDGKKGFKKWGILFLATGAFSGYLPFAPGTFGTVVGIGVVWFLWGASLSVQMVLTLLVGVLAVWVSAEAMRIFRRADPGQIVIDEIVGFMVTMIGIPCTGNWLLYAFVVFRFLDVVKLPPANLVDAKMKTGLGVVLDDVVAGIYGNILLHLMLRARI